MNLEEPLVIEFRKHCEYCLPSHCLSSLLNMSEYSWMCLNKQDFEYAPVLNMPKFWIWQVSQYASVTQRSEYVRICLDRVLNISWVLNMPELWIWQGFEYARVPQGSRHAPNRWICQRRTWICLNMSEFLIIDRVLNTQREVVLQVNEYLLRDRRIQDLVNNLIWSALEK